VRPVIPAIRCNCKIREGEVTDFGQTGSSLRLRQRQVSTFTFGLKLWENVLAAGQVYALPDARGQQAK
jgi:hypothetical protein